MKKYKTISVEDVNPVSKLAIEHRKNSERGGPIMLIRRIELDADEGEEKQPDADNEAQQDDRKLP